MDKEEKKELFSTLLKDCHIEKLMDIHDNQHVEAHTHIEPPVAKPSDPQAKSEVTEQLSISQLAILFEATLGVTYSSEYNNVNAIAKLIAAVSGYKQGSVRQKLMKLNYDSSQSAADRERVASLIEKLSPKLADKIRENV